MRDEDRLFFRMKMGNVKIKYFALGEIRNLRRANLERGYRNKFGNGIQDYLRTRLQEESRSSPGGIQKKQ